MKIDVSQVAKKLRTYRVMTEDIEGTFSALSEYGTCGISYEEKSILLDVEETVTPVNLAIHLHKKGIHVERIDMIAESEKELKETILK